MPSKFRALFATLALLVIATPSRAHHSFSAEYDIDKPVTLNGTLTKVEWINPHGWLHLEVKNADGKVESWAIETGGPNALLRRGIRKTDFPIGGQLVVKGYRAKSGKLAINGVSIKLPDGRNLFAGSSATGAPE